jgi:thiol:disulfide interchange protein
MSRDTIIITLSAAAGLAGAVAISTVMNGRSEAPAVMTEVKGLDEGIRVSGETGKPLVALVTADWCPPCQALKRDTLSDDRVTAWLAENAVSIVLYDGADNADIARLPTMGFPTTLVINDGEVVGRTMGYAPPIEYLRFLDTAVSSIRN